MARLSGDELARRGNKFSKDHQPVKNGRPKNVFKQFHKLYECSKQDVTEVLTELISKSIDELSAIKNDKTTIALRACIASAILNDRKHGSLYGVDFMINRLFGSVVQKVENSINVNADDEKVGNVLEKYGVSKSKD